MTSIAAKLRLQSGKPTIVENEISQATDERIGEAWSKVHDSLGQGTHKDQIADAMMADGWSYDVAAWMITQAQLYGRVGSDGAAPARSSNVPAGIAFLLVALVLAALKAAGGFAALERSLELPAQLGAAINILGILAFIACVWRGIALLRG